MRASRVPEARMDQQVGQYENNPRNPKSIVDGDCRSGSVSVKWELEGF